MKSRRKISRILLQMLPQKPRLAIVRKLAKIDPAWPSPSLEIKIAETESELSAAYGLLHDSYVKSGFMNPDPSGMRVLAQHLLPQTTTIVAKWDGQVIGTLSLIRDNPFGLPMEKIFDLSARRTNGRRLAEVSSLAIDPRYRGQANRSLFPLFRFVYQYARYYFGTYEFVIAVNPSSVDMYLGFMCFEKLSTSTQSYDFVKGAPAVGLYLNFETCIERWQKMFGHRNDTSNFLKYWSEIPTHPNNCLPKRAYHTAADPILTPQLLGDFFLNKAQLARKLSFSDIQVLLSVYPFPGHQKLLHPLQNFLLRKRPRMETQMRGELGPNKIIGEVWNVSNEGILFRTNPNSLTMNEVSEMTIWLNEATFTRVQVEVRWCAQKNLYGLRILNSTPAWAKMIEYLERDYERVAATALRAA